MINKNWYTRLKKSELTPPNYVFSIIWPILYTLLAISFYLMITDEQCVGLCHPLLFFSVQLVLNFLWTPLFFRYKMTRLALLSLLIIIIFTSLTYYTLFSVNVWAAYLLIPYLLWLSLAFYLNLYVVLNN